MEAFEVAVKKMKGRNAVTTEGKVKSINGITCTVERIGLPDLEDVRLNSVDAVGESFFAIYPKLGSSVVCLSIEGENAETCIVKYSEIEKIDIKMKSLTFQLYDEKVSIKNKQADVKTILNTVLLRLKNAVITTPAGPGNFSPADQLVFEQQNEKVNQILM